MHDVNTSHLTVLLRQAGCPICRARAEACNRTLTWFWIDGYNEPSWIDRLERTHEFCGRHWWQAVRTGQAYGLSHVAEYLARDATGELSRLAIQRRRRAFPAWFMPLSTQMRRLSSLRARHHRTPVDRSVAEECPLCVTEADAERYNCRTLAEALVDGELRDVYRDSGGVCLHHLRGMLPFMEDNATRALVIAHMQHRLGSLRTALTLYFHKCDYRYAHEPKGDEQTAWLRAVECFIGPDTQSPDPSSESQEEHVHDQT